MGILTEQAAEEFVAARAFVPGLPGFVGIAVDLLVDPACAPAGRRPLRHGFLDTRSPRVLAVSGPPSPGLEVALRRMGDDLAASARVVEQHRLTVISQATGSVHPEGPVSAIGAATAGIRLGLEAGLDDHRPGPAGDHPAGPGGHPTGAGGNRAEGSPAGAGEHRAGSDVYGPLGLNRRWRLAHTLAPVLAAAFANAPLRHGRPTGWRSVRQALRRDLRATPLPGDDPRAAWTAYVLDTPGRGGTAPRQRLRAGGRITDSELVRHLAGLRPPVAARGHLELDVADRQPGDGWRVPVAVAAVLMDDPRAAEEAAAATAHLAGEAGLWERAARDALTDPVLAAAARDCFLAAYAALSRQDTSRELRDAVAEFTERYVHRGRCPADDVLDGLTARAPLAP